MHYLLELQPEPTQPRVAEIFDCRIFSEYLRDTTLQLDDTVGWIDYGHLEFQGPYEVSVDDPDNGDFLLVRFVDGSRAVCGVESLTRYMNGTGQTLPDELQ